MKRQLLSLALLALGCDSFFGKLGVDFCTEDFFTCDGNTLIQCKIDDLQISTPCDDLVCNIEQGSCSACGDNVVDVNESCDDGNTISGDGCNSNCLSEAACGDGQTQDPELCDDGNTSSGDGCRADCLSLELCGDGVTEAILTEVCDDGNILAGDGCRADCQGVEICGDGFVDVANGEACDDGNASNLDDCSDTCEETFCGDGQLQPNSIRGELCDDGNNVLGDGCDALCQPEPDVNCGDGDVQNPEVCDDANTVSGDGCNSNCSAIEECGDGILQNQPVANGLNEGCDDGNTNSDDGCSDLCVVEFCGDGITNNNIEECDNGGANSNTTPNACRETCVNAFCGDGIIDNAEECDDGNNNNNDICNNQCQNNSSCGDGQIDSGETCDDGNTAFNDGCSDLCALEADLFVNCSSGFAGNGSLNAPFNNLQSAINAAGANTKRIMLLPQFNQSCNGVTIGKDVSIYGLKTLVYPPPAQLPSIETSGTPISIAADNKKISISGMRLVKTSNNGFAFDISNSNGTLVALSGVDITDTASGVLGVVCNANNTKLLIDRSSIRDVDAGVRTENGCSLLFINSLMSGTSAVEFAINSTGAAQVSLIRSTISSGSIQVNCQNATNHRVDSLVLKSSNVSVTNCTNVAPCDNPNLTNGGEGGVFAPFHLASNAPCFNNANTNPNVSFDPGADFNGLGFPFSLDVLNRDVKGAIRAATPDKGMFDEAQ
jgi:cysteine-rich repeat protein